MGEHKYKLCTIVQNFYTLILVKQHNSSAVYYIQKRSAIKTTSY